MDWPDLAAQMQDALIGSALSESITFTLGDVESSTVRGIYQRPPIETSEGGAAYQGAEHRVTVRASDLPSWVERDPAVRIMVRDLELGVVDLYPDGQGLVSIECRR